MVFRALSLSIYFFANILQRVMLLLRPIGMGPINRESSGMTRR
jgi:hypothetical protein